LFNHSALWQFLLTALSTREPVVLLIVTDSIGSSPGTIGAKMAVTQRACVGTIGGGAIEAELIKTTRVLLKKQESHPRLVRRAHHHSDKIENSGMICGGEQTVLIYPCQREDQIIFKELLTNLQHKTPKTLSISAEGLELLPTKDSLCSPIFNEGDPWCYQETVGLYKQAYIIGAGHISLPLSQILNMLAFDITVIDDRKNLDSMQANIYAEQKWCLPYTDIDKHIPEGTDIFVFIMTHSHHCDELVLTKLAGKQFAYLGLLGSYQKIDHMKQNLTRKYLSIHLQHIHAPIGLPINSHTPEEIAVSIAAEIIKILNTKSND